MRTQIILLSVLLVVASGSILGSSLKWLNEKTMKKGFSDRFSGPTYQSQKAEQKLNQLWEEITSDTTPFGWHSLLTQLSIFVEDMQPTFETYSDVFPEGRKKLTHSTGAVAQVEYIAEKDVPYTGVFKTGAAHATIRFATATETNPKNEAWTNFNPALSLKILRDKVPSANIQAMYTAEGQKTFNPFGSDYSNHIPHPTTKKIQMLSKKFSEATPYTGRLGLKTVGQFDANGNEEANIKIPFRVIFSATDAVSKMFPDTFADYLYNQLKTIPAGTAIYDVLAIEKPYGDAVKIGTIKTKTAFTTSMFGDTQLFSKHSFVEDDIKLNPTWAEAYKVDPPIPFKRA
jgi:hypothetical protein